MRHFGPRISRRFSLRAVMIAVTLMVVAFAVRTNQVRRHDRAVTALRARGAIFYRDFEDPIGPNWLWMRNGLGHGALEREGLGWLLNTPLSITGWRAVFLADMILTDEDLGLLADVIDLQQVSLEQVPISEAVVSAIARLPAVNRVAMTSSTLDDSAVPRLLELRGADDIWLDAPAISIDGWRRLEAGLGEALCGR